MVEFQKSASITNNSNHWRQIVSFTSTPKPNNNDNDNNNFVRKKCFGQSLLMPAPRGQALSSKLRPNTPKPNNNDNDDFFWTKWPGAKLADHSIHRLIPYLHYIIAHFCLLISSCTVNSDTCKKVQIIGYGYSPVVENRFHNLMPGTRGPSHLSR